MLVLILVMALLGVAVGFVLDVACNRVPVVGLRYPVVELVTAVLFVALALRLLGDHLLVALPAYLYLVAVGVALTLIDLGCRRLPMCLCCRPTRSCWRCWEAHPSGSMMVRRWRAR